MPRDSRLYMTFPNNFHHHPKIYRLPVEVRWAFVEMNGEARIADNDGIFLIEDAEFMWSREMLDALVASHPTRPLVVRTDEHYVIRDYAEHQQTRAEREARVLRNTTNGRLGGRPKKNPAITESVTTGNRTVTEVKAEIETELEIDTYVPEDSLVSSEAVPAPRPDVETILRVLDAELARNGTKAPARSKKNVDAARLLLDRDGYSVDQVVRAIRWSQSDEFWRTNILSMSKLREKYDQLRLAAERKRNDKAPTSKADKNAAEYQRLYGGQHERAGSVPALDPGIG